MNQQRLLVRNYKKAIPLMLIGAVFLTLQAIFVKLVSSNVNSSVLVFTRGFVCLIAVLIFGRFTSSIHNYGDLF